MKRNIKMDQNNMRLYRTSFTGLLIRKLCFLSFLFLSVNSAATHEDDWASAALDDGTWTYEISGDKVTVTGCSKACPVELIIPETIAGKSVTSIGYTAFHYSGLTSIIMPDTITSIEDEAFVGNPLLSGDSVTFSNGLSIIGQYAFYESFLGSVTIPMSVTSIGENGLGQVNKVAFHGDRPVLDYNVFEEGAPTLIITYCDKQLGWPGENINTRYGTVTPVSGLCPHDNDNDGVPDDLDPFPTDPNENLDTDSDGIGNNADMDDDGDGVADDNDSFPLDASETLDADGDSVGDNSDVYPNNALETADSDHDGLGDNSDPFPLDPFNSLFSYTDNGINVTVTGCKNTCSGNLLIPKSIGGKPVTEVGLHAFFNKQLTGVLIPDSVITIGSSAFSSNQLTSLVIPNSVITIVGSAFENNLLENITIPASIKTIGARAFIKNELKTLSFLGNKPAFSVGSSFSHNFDLHTITFCDNKSGWPGASINNGRRNRLTPIIDSDCDSFADIYDKFPANPDEVYDTDNDGIGNNADSDDDNDGLPDEIDSYPLDFTNQTQKLHDIDGNGSVDALTDLMLIMRHGFGFRGETLIDGVIGGGATRTTSAEIEAYLEALIPEL